MNESCPCSLWETEGVLTSQAGDQERNNREAESIKAVEI